MKQIIVGDNEKGQRFDKLLFKILNNAGKSFVYKMLRKKNIVLNGKKATGNEKLQKGDEIKIFLSDETFEKFSSQEDIVEEVNKNVNEKKINIVYEDENVIFINKEAGMLSQKDVKDSVSVVEYVIKYLLDTKQITKEQLKSFKPSVCNRLDRNTSGLIVAGKSLIGLQKMSEYIKNKTVEKYYLTIVKGNVKEKKCISSVLEKNEKNNTVTIKNSGNGALIKTEYEPIKSNGKYTLLKIKLITGKTHQIRAHLASIGYPVIGDYKYGNRKENDYFKKKYGVEFQLLHSYQMIFPKLSNDVLKMSGKVITAQLPEVFNEVKNGILEK